MSQELLKSIQERRTIRRFTEQDVEPEKLTAVLEAIRWSQSWANTQCWEIIVVQDKQIQTELQALISPRNPATKAMVSAPVVLAVCGKHILPAGTTASSQPAMKTGCSMISDWPPRISALPRTVWGWGQWSWVFSIMQEWKNCLVSRMAIKLCH